MNRIKFIALIVDHKLRKESSHEAIWVKNNLLKCNIASEILVWEHHEVSSNIHKKARDARFALMSNYCKKHNIDHLLVAHNKEDQAETVFMRILRGTGIDGLVAINPKSKLNGLTICRPMLDISRVDIESYLKENKIEYVNDPSNQDLKYTRVKIRKLLKEINNEYGIDVFSRLNLLSHNANNSSSYLKQRAKIAYRKLVENSNHGVFYLNFNGFNKLHIELKCRVLRLILKQLSLNYYPPRLNSLKIFLDKIINRSKNIMLSGVRVDFKDDEAIFFIEASASHEIHLKSGESANFLGVDIENIFEETVVVKTLGESGWIQLKAKGYKKPNFIKAQVLKSTVAIFDEEGKLVKSLFFNSHSK